jgi:prefoldin subunit 5
MRQLKMLMTEREFFETLERLYKTLKDLEEAHEDIVTTIEATELKINSIVDNYYAQNTVDNLIDKIQERINNG